MSNLLIGWIRAVGALSGLWPFGCPGTAVYGRCPSVGNHHSCSNLASRHLDVSAIAVFKTCRRTGRCSDPDVSVLGFIRGNTGPGRRAALLIWLRGSVGRGCRAVWHRRASVLWPVRRGPSGFVHRGRLLPCRKFAVPEMLRAKLTTRRWPRRPIAALARLRRSSRHRFLMVLLRIFTRNRSSQLFMRKVLLFPACYQVCLYGDELPVRCHGNACACATRSRAELNRKKLLRLLWFGLALPVVRFCGRFGR